MFLMLVVRGSAQRVSKNKMLSVIGKIGYAPLASDANLDVEMPYTSSRVPGAPSTPVVQLIPLSISDLNLLHTWLNRAHLRPYYMQRAISASEVRRKFTPRLSGTDPCRSLIAKISDVPFGYIQWYLNASFPDYGTATIGETDGVSFDYFIGEAAYLSKGLGPAMLNAAVRLVSTEVDDKDRIFFVGHQKENMKAISCSQRAGFVYWKAFLENGVPSALYRRDEH